MSTLPHVKNPLQDQLSFTRQAEPCILVIFGATGDLTSRKLMPALYNLMLEGLLPSQFACVGFARRDKSDDDFRQEMHDAVKEFSRTQPIDEQAWKNFAQQIYYHRSEFGDGQGYDSLNKKLQDLDAKLGTKGNRVFYFSTPPSYFPEIIKNLSDHKLIYDPDEKQRWSRVIIEKPFGHDLNSSIELQKIVSQYLSENQVFRIDHYLGKETVQNLLVFRFANSIFESLWNNNHIDNVQITVAEEIGIGTRGKFWEEAGMMRDIVQNHMMQLLSLVAMEPPVSLQADAIRNEKTKVVESIRPIDMNPDSFHKHVVRGQYAEGLIDGKPVIGYRQEDNVARDSVVETFVAMQLFIDNWRWAGVPFYLRAGKRCAKRATEIAIEFKEAPGVLFQRANKKNDPNVLVIRIQPDEGISLKFNSKVPGINAPIQPVKMDFRYGSYFGSSPPEAYERLICDCMAGDSTLFARDDKVIASWRIVTPILERWQEEKGSDLRFYQAGSWGPEEANGILTGKRRWRLI